MTNHEDRFYNDLYFIGTFPFRSGGGGVFVLFCFVFYRWAITMWIIIEWETKTENAQRYGSTPIKVNSKTSIAFNGKKRARLLVICQKSLHKPIALAIKACILYFLCSTTYGTLKLIHPYLSFFGSKRLMIYCAVS